VEFQVLPAKFQVWKNGCARRGGVDGTPIISASCGCATASRPTNIKNNDFAYFLKLVAPYRHDLTVCAECMFGWYWLADACQDARIHFVLAHALYLTAIHGGKNKNDRIYFRVQRDEAEPSASRSLQWRVSNLLHWQ
jgi:hypothetical protein